MVTGGAGFIGANLCKELIKEGANVILCDNLSTGSEKNLRFISEYGSFHFEKIDVNNDYDKLKEIFRKNSPEYVFHLAAFVGVKRNIENPLKAFEDMKGIENVVKLCLDSGVEKLVFSSSSEVYGEPVTFPQNETSPLNPKIPYAVVKIYGEKLLETYYLNKGLRFCTVRIFNAYGPLQNNQDGYGFVIGIFFSNLLSGNAVILYGDGKQTRDFIFVDDLVNILVSTLKEDFDGKIVNVGTGKPITILHLYRMICDVTGIYKEPLFENPRPYEVRHRWADITQLQKLIGEPKTEIKEGLLKTFEFLKKQR